MSKAEYLALAEQKYTDLQALATQPTFYDYQKSFEVIWLGGHRVCPPDGDATAIEARRPTLE